MPFVCCICNKNGKLNSCSLFTIPKEPYVQKEWLLFCNIKENPDANYIKYRVCNNHFVSSDIRKMYPRPLLRKGAIPCIRNIRNEKIQEQTVETVL